MGLFYKASDKDLLQIRKKIFFDYGVPALSKNGFEATPFKSNWHGYNPGIMAYMYEFWRLAANNELHMIDVVIFRGEKWIQISLNVFTSDQRLDSVQQLIQFDGMQFHIPPAQISKMRLPADEIKTPYFFSRRSWFDQHKLGTYYTKSGLNKRVTELGNTIHNDLSNIDHFVKLWHQRFKPAHAH